MKIENVQEIIDFTGLKADKGILNLLSKFKIKKNGNGLILVAPNNQFKEWAEDILLKNMERNVSLISIVTAEEGASNKSKPHFNNDGGVLHDNGICSRLTFDNYIVGSSNKMVYEIAKIVANQNSNLYNPLIIYGRVGVGKTHILHAIGNRRREIGYSVVYKSINDFSEEVVKFAMEGKITLLRYKYKNVDVLLIDDIQFLAKKERTQAELFNIFNSLLMMGKQIVLTSDRHPRDLTDVSDRLINRFSAGLIVELDIDRETKEAIIRRKLEEYNIPQDESIVNYIIDITGNNVREVEGAIRRIKILGTDGIFSETVKSGKEDLSFSYIKKVVSSYYGVNPEDLEKGSRKKRIADARHVCMYLSKKLLSDVSLIQIGRAFGVRDHTTVIHAIHKIEERKKKDRRFGYFLSTIERHIRQKA